ncbi:MAG: acyl-CoA dehydratase activase-related protein [Polyangia bacterium]
MRYRADPPTRRIRPRGRRIGVPRALAFHELRRFFDHLLESSGFEPIRSPHSSQAILSLGLDRCIDEVCFPLKTFFGHVARLELDGLDTVLVPRVISLAKGRNHCPKFHVLPDMIERAFPRLAVLAPYIDLHHSPRATLIEHLRDACRPMLVELGAWRPDGERRIDEAWRAEIAGEREAPPRSSDGLRIAMLGHLYAERDSFLGLGVAKLLRSLGAEVVRSPRPLSETPCPFEEGMYYESSVRTARALERRLEEGIDGAVLMTYFACGPDSYSADTILYRMDRRAARIPVLRLILDEHTSREGLLTRLSAFVDVARHRRAQHDSEEGRC